jgi:hypothetical protein
MDPTVYSYTIECPFEVGVDHMSNYVLEDVDGQVL